MDDRKRLWVVIGAIGAGMCGLACMVALVLAFINGSGISMFAGPASGGSLAIGSTAPDFELPALDGGTITLSQYQGSPVLLALGATWCSDCEVAAPRLQKLYENYPDLVVLAVNSNEDVGTVQEFADKHGLTYPIALDEDGEVMRRYGILAIPSLFFIDRDGVVQTILVETYSNRRERKALTTIGITP
ncbi:MAG: redoxin domain-containing protein [Anaerolineae bacterium]|nr:redoxin domain-containing protein [Anaerolineae bacterium]